MIKFPRLVLRALAGVAALFWSVSSLPAQAATAPTVDMPAGLVSGLREGDANVRSVWLCTRNDMIANLAVLLAAIGVFGTKAGWPDIAVASIMALLGLSAARDIIGRARAEIRGLGTSTT